MCESVLFHKTVSSVSFKISSWRATNLPINSLPLGTLEVSVFQSRAHQNLALCLSPKFKGMREKKERRE